MIEYHIIKDRKIRIALVGCGRISKNHFESIKYHHNNIELRSRVHWINDNIH